MRPRLAFHNTPDVCVTDLECIGKFSHSLALRMPFPYSFDLFHRQFAIKSVPAHHVIRVISMCANVKMVWSNACTIIAMMANKHSFRNCHTVVQFPREARCANLFSVNPEVPVSLCDQRTSPNPTLTRRIDLSPESVKQCRGLPVRIAVALPSDVMQTTPTPGKHRVIASGNGAWSARLGVHLTGLSLGAMLRAVTAAPGRFYASILPYTSLKQAVS